MCGGRLTNVQVYTMQCYRFQSHRNHEKQQIHWNEGFSYKSFKLIYWKVFTRSINFWNADAQQQVSWKCGIEVYSFNVKLDNRTQQPDNFQRCTQYATWFYCLLWNLKNEEVTAQSQLNCIFHREYNNFHGHTIEPNEGKRILTFIKNFFSEQLEKSFNLL